MKKLLICFITCVAISYFPKSESQTSKYEDEIRKAEKNFNDYAQAKSISEAFYAFADENAVIKRENDTLIKGRENIRSYYKRLDKAKVTWSPDFVSVSADGTLGCTYGKYDWKMEGKDGKVQSFKGVFHTVWKRQKDGSWKYVWD
ncbi:nuclear transport factor 2 family protein [Flavobacterium sp. MAH-1]|uniref:Nuclear transport factor 2 family protein n=1 Tax=Flavobacterium agri TaxID=2743471 RepID=A0A7Y8Y4Y8_9FLAO|nr:DUF4440 domain-containing protein [Flavobacterium agri]NUY82604.1 nuclear transport factor 2 family protein [Flavobacterium agri]NYA72627.1 nuclear transport factor 2 family protein [Flavobacterium agri]